MTILDLCIGSVSPPIRCFMYGVRISRTILIRTTLRANFIHVRRMTTELHESVPLRSCARMSSRGNVDILTIPKEASRIRTDKSAFNPAYCEQIQAMYVPRQSKPTETGTRLALNDPPNQACSKCIKPRSNSQEGTDI